MQIFNSWGETFISSLQNLWFDITAFVPQLIGAMIVLLAGLIISASIGKLIKRLVGFVRIDAVLEKMGVMRECEKAGLHFSFSGTLGWAVKWFFIVVTLIAVVDILKLPQVTAFLKSVAFYIPNVVVAVVILAIGVVAGNFVHGVIQKGASASHLSQTAVKPLSAIAKWAIIVFALMAALVQLGVAAALVQILFTGLVAMVALAGGLAFGLGGRDRAREWLDRLGREVGG